MKRRGLFALGFFLLSTTALLPLYDAAAKTTGQGGDPRQVGLVKPLSSWKVGTISAEAGQRPYCAMVGTFERGMVLAIARNDKGMGSLAMDFKDPVFETNVRYPVWVDVEGGSSREFQGVASSDRSLVVQFGKDENFYRALTRSSRVDVSTPDVDVGFVLSQAQSGSRKLETCSAQLVSPASGSGDIAEEQEVTDNPVDAEASRLTAENVELQKARDEVATLKSRLASASKYDDIDAEIARRMAEHERRYQARVTELEQREKDLQRQLDERKNQIVWSEQAARQDKDAVAVTARLEAEKKAMSGELEAMTRQNKLLQAALEDKVAELGKADVRDPKQDSRLTSVTRELDDLRASSQKQIADLTAALAKKTGEVESLSRAASAQALTAGQTATYKQQIVGLEQQISELRKMRESEGPRADQALAELGQARAEIAELKKALPAEQQRVASLQTSLEKRQAELDRQAKAQADEASRLDARRAELEKMRGDIASNEYQGTLETRGKVQELLNVPSVSAVQLSSVQAELTRMQADLERQASAQKAEAEWLESERARLEKAKSAMPAGEMVASERAELDAARARISELEKGYTQSTARVAELEASLRQRLSGQTADNARQMADLERRERELAAREVELGQKLAMIDKNSATVEEETQDKAVGMAGELARTRTELEGERANVTTARAEIARLQQIIAGDQQKIAALQGDLAAKTTLADATAKTDLRLAELSAENTRLKEQASGRALAEAELARLQQIIAGDQQKIAALQGDLAAKTTLADATAKTDLRLAELAAENERLKEQAGGRALAEAELARLQKIVADNQAKVNPNLNVTDPATTAMQARLVELERTVGEQRKLLAQKDADLSDSRNAMAMASARSDDLTAAVMPAAGADVPSVVQVPMPVEKPVVAIAPTVDAQPSYVAPAAPEVKTAARTNGWRDWLGLGRGKDTGVWSYGPVRGADAVPVKTPAPVVAQEGPSVVAAPAVPVQRADVLGEDRSYNKAAAFLDEIMAVHRGEKISLSETPGRPFMSADPDVSDVADGIEPASGEMSDVSFLTDTPRANSLASVVPVVPHNETSYSPKAATMVPGVISMPPAAVASVPAVAVPLAVTASAPVPVSSPVPLVQPQLSFDDVVVRGGNDRPSLTSRTFQADPGIEGELRNLLSAAKIDTDGLTVGTPSNGGDGDFVFYQWSAGELNGLFEQTAWDATTSFESMVESYIDRYREDCPGQLSVSIGNFEKVGDATMAGANVSCGMSGNSYVSSFVFSGTAGTFSALLHTGFPDTRAAVLSIGDRIEDALRKRDGRMGATARIDLQPPAAFTAVDLPVILSDVAPASGGENGSKADEFQTVYIQ